MIKNPCPPQWRSLDTNRTLGDSPTSQSTWITKRNQPWGLLKGFCNSLYWSSSWTATISISLTPEITNISALQCAVFGTWPIIHRVNALHNQKQNLPKRLKRFETWWTVVILFVQGILKGNATDSLDIPPEKSERHIEIMGFVINPIQLPNIRPKSHWFSA